MQQLYVIIPHVVYVVRVRKMLKMLYKCTKCQSGNYCSKACQIKQYLEHKKYRAVVSELDSREKHKL